MTQFDTSSEVASSATPDNGPDIKPAGPAFLWLLRLLALAGLGISAFLLYITWSGDTSVPGCGAGGEGAVDCDSVLASRWSSWLTLPVSLPAVLVYALILVASFALGEKATVQERRGGRWMLAALAVMAGGAAVWFITVQLAWLDAICPWCMGAHASSLAIAGLTFTWLWGQRRRGVPRLPLAALVGVLALGGLVLGQVLGPAPGPKMRTTAAARDFDTGPGPNREVSMLGQAKLQPHAFPMLGSPDAQRIFVYLFDYTCPHCAMMHRDLEKAIERYGDQMGVVLLPVPLDPACNPVVRQLEPRHKSACDLAILALATWKVDPEAFAELDSWLVQEDDPPAIGAAQAKAFELVEDDAALEAALADPWPREQIQRNVQLYQMAQGGQIPKLISGSIMASGRPPDLFAFLEGEWGLEPVE